MKALPTLALLVSATCLWAQSGDPAIAQAKSSIEKIRALVEAGAVPRARLEKPEDQLADAEDVAYLRHSLYGQELTEDQSDEMIAAANRRLERRKKAYDEGKKLVDAGVAAESSLAVFQQDIESAQKEVELAGARARLTQELAEMAKAEEALETKLAQTPAQAPEVAERFDGDGAFNSVAWSKIEKEYEKEFGKPLPVSAIGETAVHRALGFDHTGRIDVAVNPDQPEGVWLRDFLTANHIPYFAFRHAVPGKATGAHIHIGPMSTRLKLGG